MLIKNLTSKKQIITLKEYGILGNEYDICIEPQGTTDIDKFSIINLDNLVASGILGIVDGTVDEVAPDTIIFNEDPEDEEDIVDVPDETIEESSESTESIESEQTNEESSDSEFTCDECGAVLASARGLAAHKNRVHAHK